MNLRGKSIVIRSVRINKLLAISLLTSSLIAIPQVIGGGNFAANANVTVPESSTATTLYVSPPEFRVISTGTNSVVMDFSAAIGQPSGWNESTQRIAVEIAITAGGSDTSAVFRGTGNCIVDLSASANADSFGTTVANGSTTPTGVDAAIFVLNDRTPQLTINGEIDDVLTAIQRVRIECDTYNDLRNKYVRIGAVPTQASGQCGNADTWCEPLYYLFSTSRYYTSACSNVNVTDNLCGNTGQTSASATVSGDDNGIRNLRSRAEAITIGVDASARSGATRGGWVATLTTRDEILLTNALGLVSMIGTTDMDQSWAWNSTAWGTPSGGNCPSSEGNFYWLGPDNWCQRIPARNSDVGGGSQYWRLDANGRWIPSTLADLPTNGGINLASGTAPTEANWSGTTNGKGFSHFWAANNSGIVEPNNSNDFIYGGYNAGDGVPGWDDAGLNRNARMYVEFCSPAQPCTPPDSSVASTEILPDQTMTLRKGTSKLVDAQSNWASLPELSFGNETATNIVICIGETNTSTSTRSFQFGFGIGEPTSADTRIIVSRETVTAVTDSIFESSSNAGRTLIFEGPSSAVFNVFNGSGALSSALRFWLPSGNYFSWNEEIWIRVVARSEIGRPLPASLCRQVQSANSWVVSLRPYLVEQTVRQGEVQGNKRGQS